MIGIYKIENLINHKVYIGQSVAIKSRLNHHRQMLNNGKHFCPHLQHSWFKYGENNFSFEILEECSKEQLDNRENFWLKKYGGYESKQTYNQRGAGQETHNVSEKTKEKLRKANLGKKASKETLEKISKALKGHPYWGRKWTEEEKKRASERQKGKINDGARYFDRTNPIYRKHLSESLKGKKKSKEHAKHISEGRKGIVFTEEHIKNISLGRRGIASTPKGTKKMEKDGVIKMVPPNKIEKYKQEGWQENHTFYCGNYVKGEPWNKGKHLSKETKQLLREINLGKKASEETKKKIALSMQNVVWVNNAVINKRIHKDELEMYLSQGWRRGRIRK